MLNMLVRSWHTGGKTSAFGNITEYGYYAENFHNNKIRR
jgi:hypothetical protein